MDSGLRINNDKWVGEMRSEKREQARAKREQASLFMHGSIMIFLGLCAGIGLSYAAYLDSSDYGAWRFAHLEGIINGILVMAVGASWLCIQQSLMVRLARWLLLLGCYCNTIGPLITAIFVGGRVLEPTNNLEAFIVYVFYIPGCLPLISFLLFAIGFYQWKRVAERSMVQ